MAREGCRIAVIGAGFSGVMTAIHLLWRCEPGERVYLVERGDRVGPGLAYGTHNAAPSRQRARREHERVRGRAGSFRPLARAARARAPGRGWRAHDRRHVRAPLGVRRLRPGAAARGDQPPGRRRQSLSRHRRGDGDPPGQRRLPPGDRERPAATRSMRPSWRWATWSRRRTAAGLCRQSLVEAATAPLEPGRPVVVLGTGLTMVDVCLSLVEQGFAGPIHAISRRGLLPLGHAPSTPWNDLVLTLGTVAPCSRCSVPSGARCGAPGRPPSAGGR